MHHVKTSPTMVKQRLVQGTAILYSYGLYTIPTANYRSLKHSPKEISLKENELTILELYFIT